MASILPMESTLPSSTSPTACPSATRFLRALAEDGAPLTASEVEAAHLYAYLGRFTKHSTETRHRYFREVRCFFNWLVEAGRNGSGPREAYFRVNNILGLVRACQQGLGIAALPDYLVEENNRLVQLFGETDSIAVDTYFVYPEELKTVARVQVFRDFVVSKAQRWPS